jgi:hypothetical protein
MKPIQIISQDVFDKIRSRFQNLEMGDESGAVTIDPAEARFFDFDFVMEGVDLGRVSISLNDLGSLKIYYSRGITENQDNPAKKTWYEFLKEMRFFAMRRLLRFDTRDISKNNLDRKDFQYLANKGTEEPEMTKMNESRWSQKSTKKTSRAVKGTTEVIVRHNRSVDEMYPGSRSQRNNIKAIFIQNRDGERFKYPFIHPAGAFAMAQHVDHGGVPHDPAGKAIMRMSEQIAQLQEFSRHVQHSQLHDDAMGIRERAHSQLHTLKKTIEGLGKRHHYENWIAEFNEQEIMDDDLVELDAVTMEEYKSKFTQSNFKEELAKFFPLIHRIMQETNTIDLEEYAEKEGKHTVHCSQCGGEFRRDEKQGFSRCKDHAGMKNYDVDESFIEETEYTNTSANDFSKFEEWAEAVEQGNLTNDQIKGLKQALADLQVPLDLDTAFNFFNEFGIDDQDLENKFDQAKQIEKEKDPEELGPDTDPLEIFKSWADENYPELLVSLELNDTDNAPEEPAPEEPEANLQPAAENDEMVLPSDSMKEDNKTSMIKEVAKIVRQFYNEDNPKVGPFRGEEGILIDVEKQISEMFGEEAGQQARDLAKTFMEKLTMKWQDRHGTSSGVADDGLARLKELTNIIKTKVEGIGDRGHGGEDFNKNIMSAEEEAKKVDIPAYKRKESGNPDWKVTQKDLEKDDERNLSSKAGLEKRKRDLGIDEDFTRILKLSGLAK